jgi:hypothetical protein
VVIQGQVFILVDHQNAVAKHAGLQVGKEKQQGKGWTNGQKGAACDVQKQIS